MKLTRLTLSLILFLLAFAPMQARAAIATAATPCALTWDLEPFPDRGAPARFDAIDAAAANDLWAIGTLGENRSALLLEHWDGAQWSQAPTPDVGNNSLPLYPTAIETLSPTDAWAVGYYSENYFPLDAFVIHWDGSTWNNFALPIDYSIRTQLFSISAINSNDVWAVGIEGDHGLVLHWNGTQWEKFSNPIAGVSFQKMFRVTATGPNDVWMIGEYEQPQQHYSIYFAVILHWDGTAWNLVTEYRSQSFHGLGVDKDEIVFGLAVPTQAKLWVLSQTFASSSNSIGGQNAHVRYWDGATWQTVEQDYFPSWNAADLKAPTAEALWVITQYNPYATGQQFSARHWDGTTYHYDSLPMPKGAALLKSVAVVSADDVWIVGETYNYPNPNQPYLARGQLPCAPIPLTPKLIAPPRNAITPRAPHLDWTKVADTHYYELVVSRTRDFIKPALATITRQSKYEFTKALRAGETYYWHVRACNNAGCGEWSKRRSFTTGLE